MPVSLRNMVLQSPGTLGLNTQNTDRVQDPQYATEANNCVISKNGLLESRKGFKKFNNSAAVGTPTFDVVYSYLTDSGTEHIISCGGNLIYTGSAMTDKTPTVAPTGDDWHFQSYEGEVIGYQDGHAPIYWDGGAGVFLPLSGKAAAAGIVQSPWHLAAWGRSWVNDTTNLSQINYSDLLIPEAFTGGTSGSIDMDKVWPYSNDTIVCCAQHNNNLIIFCYRSIIVYSGADDPSSMVVSDIINSNGCVARDSVQNVGNDIFYLANDGVRSLARTVLQDNMPMNEISAPIREDIIASINSATLTSVRSTYNEKHGFYIINFPGDKAYVCDVRRAQEGIFRWTTWDADIYGLTTSYTLDDELYAGLTLGFVGTYEGYNDTNTTTGNIDATYIMKYRSGWVDAGLEAMKGIWKKAVWYVQSLINVQVSTTWGFDFSDEEDSYTKDIVGGTASVYGTDVYGTGTYGSASTKQAINIPLSKTGSVIKLGFQSVVDSGSFAFNKIDLFVKQGHRR